MADGMRIALIGVVASLLGTLIGGGVTYAVTQSQISSQKAESRRSERLDAYSTYLGDTNKSGTTHSRSSLRARHRQP
jgi:hypothetical protein